MSRPTEPVPQHDTPLPPLHDRVHEPHELDAERPVHPRDPRRVVVSERETGRDCDPPRARVIVPRRRAVSAHPC